MAKGGVKPPVEWITVRYRDVYIVMGIIGLMILFAIGGLVWYKYAGNPKAKAEMKIRKAETKYQEIEKSGGSSSSNLRLARENINKAKTAFEKGNFGQALTLASEAIEILKNIGLDSENFATIVEIEGTVEIKKANAHIFKQAKKGEFLSEGDIVKTGSGSSGKIKYPTGEYVSLTPDSYLIIQNLRKEKGGTIVKTRLEQGALEQQTPPVMNPNDESIVETANARFKPKASTRLLLERKEGRGTTAKVLEGEVKAETDRESRDLNASVNALAFTVEENGKTSISELISPPKPIYPREFQIIQLEDPPSSIITFEWENPKNQPVRFQISAKPLFNEHTNIIDKGGLLSNNMKIKGLLPSTYYWRVRTDGDEEKCYWSSSRPFKIVQKVKTPKIERDLKLEVSYTPLGDGVIIRGKTNPGVHVSVNDIEISVGVDGSFNKIVIFSDLGTQLVVVRAFDDQGNEKVWKKSFTSSQM